MSASIRVEHDRGVAVVTIDVPNESVNTLKPELAEEFDAVLDALESRDDVEALVLRSGKPGSFVAGADLDVLVRLESAAEGAALSRLAQRVHGRIASMAQPGVAAIHGQALGGGLELALAFDARVASDHPQTRLGLPEVQLGLLPGGGGTQRLPPLVGLADALDLLLTGRQVSARRALELGLVDRLAAPAALDATAIELARALARRRRGERARALGRPIDGALSGVALRHALMARNPLGRRLTFARARARARARTQGHYPAPLAILDVVETGLARGEDAGLAAEAEAFGELAVSPVSARLVGLFFATTALKADPGVDDPAAQPAEVSRIAVIGAGLMGAGIAHVSARHGSLEVALKDRDRASAQRGLDAIARSLDRSVSRASMSAEEREACLARIRAVDDYAQLGDVQVVIEAVFEDLELKRGVLRAVEENTPPGSVFASNTSSIPITRICESSQRAQDVLGMHYFSPVERMPLLEIVRTAATSDRAVATCVALGKRQGKTVIVVRDGPGFYTSRILTPYMNEAAWLLAEGVAIERIDQSLVELGFPVGPIALLDDVGLDVGAKVAGVMQQSFGDRMASPPGLAALAADGRLGRKSGRGFYAYGRTSSGKRRADPSVYTLLGVTPGTATSSGEIAERCLLQMVNEAVRCLEEGVVRSARDGDVGAVMGLGFPPYLGGPFSYVDARGARRVLERLETIRDRIEHAPESLGGSTAAARFEPAALLREKAAAGQRFREAPPGGRAALER